jgi:hypothetical protein
MILTHLKAIKRYIAEIRQENNIKKLLKPYKQLLLKLVDGHTNKAVIINEGKEYYATTLAMGVRIYFEDVYEGKLDEYLSRGVRKAALKILNDVASLTSTKSKVLLRSNFTCDIWKEPSTRDTIFSISLRVVVIGDGDRGFYASTNKKEGAKIKILEIGK